MDEQSKGTEHLAEVTPNNPSSLTLLCQAVDEDKNLFEDIFPVTVQSSVLVGELKEQVFAKMKPLLEARGIVALQLTLWKVSTLIPTEIIKYDQNIQAIEFPDVKSPEARNGNGVVQLLHPPRRLDKYWPEMPEEELLHLIVRVPCGSVGKGSVKRKSDQEESLARARARARVRLNEFASPAPSSLAKPDRFKVKASGLVKCNRPFDYSTLPISLLQREFAEFKDDLILEPSVIAFKLLDDLTLASCKWHDNENLRRDEIASVIGNTANVSLLPTFISGSSRSTDGNTHPATVIPALIRECKNNEGCALFEAIAYYSNFLRCHLNLSDGQTELFTRFPSILMADVGTQIGFYCCVWTGLNILVEPLTPIYDLTTHWTDEKMRQQIAVALGAVLKTIFRLNQHYQRINESPRTKIQNEYPFQNSYVDHTGLCTEFTYTSRIQNKLVFKAVSKANDDLVIKFTRRYSSTAHGFLASLGHAPAIRAINDIPGGWKMIVMESSPYTLLYDLCPILDDKTRSAIKETVKEVTGKLHLQELVHGDIRQANILVSERTLNSPEGISFHLIDFDWAGPAGAVKYPMGVNIETIRRPRDVAGGKLITKSHDLEMINLLF